MVPRKLYSDRAIHVRLTDEIQDLMTAEALRRNVTISQIVREALEKHYAHTEREYRPFDGHVPITAHYAHTNEVAGD